MKKVLALALVALALLGTVRAIGVAQDYPSAFTMKSGSNATYQFRVSNTAGETERFTLEPIKDTEIVSISPMWKEYSVEPGEKLPITLFISLPNDAKPEYNPTIRVTEFVEDTDAMIDTGIAIDMSIRITVEMPEEEIIEPEEAPLEGQQPPQPYQAPPAEEAPSTDMTAPFIGMIAAALLISSLYLYMRKGGKTCRGC